MEELKKIREDLNINGPRPIYFLMGAEAYLIDQAVSYIEKNAINEAQSAFNTHILYGKEVSVDQIIGLAKQYPFGSDRQLVLVREAQHLSRTIDQLVAYVQNPQPSTVLIFAYKYQVLDKRKAIFKALSKTNAVYTFNPLYDNQVPGFIEQLAKNSGWHIAPQTTHLLHSYLGTDLGKIHNELEKLKLVLPVGGEITPLLIEEYIGISKEFNNFELKKALAERNVQQVMRIIQYFYQNPKENPFVVTLSILHQFFTQVMQYHCLQDHNPKAVATQLGINPFFVGELTVGARNYPMKKVSAILHEIRSLDLKGKGVGTQGFDQEQLLKELVYKVM